MAVLRLVVRHLRRALMLGLRFCVMLCRRICRVRVWMRVRRRRGDADLVDSSVNRALDALEDAGRPCSFPRWLGRHAFHDMTLVGRASYLLQHADELGCAAFEEAGRISRSRLCRCVMSCVFAPEIDDAVQVSLDRGALGARIVGGGLVAR